MTEQTYENASVYLIELDKISPNPFQPRREFSDDKLGALASSIRQYGVLQPIVVTRKEYSDGAETKIRYELIAGERRFRASKIAGLEKIPAIVREGDHSDKEKFELAIIENIQREDLNPVDKAQAFQELIDNFDLTHAQVAEKMSKSREFVSNALRILKLPEYILEGVVSGEVSEGHTRPLLMLDTRKEDQKKLFEKIKREQITVREAERYARNIATEKVRKKPKEKRPEILALEKKLERTLGTRVQIETSNTKGNSGKVTIEYFSKDDLNNILKIVSKEKNKDLGKNEITSEGSLSSAYQNNSFSSRNSEEDTVGEKASDTKEVQKGDEKDAGVQNEVDSRKEEKHKTEYSIEDKREDESVEFSDDSFDDLDVFSDSQDDDLYSVFDETFDDEESSVAEENFDSVPQKITESKESNIAEEKTEQKVEEKNSYEEPIKTESNTIISAKQEQEKSKENNIQKETTVEESKIVENSEDNKASEETKKIENEIKPSEKEIEGKKYQTEEKIKEEKSEDHQKPQNSFADALKKISNEGEDADKETQSELSENKITDGDKKNEDKDLEKDKKKDDFSSQINKLLEETKKKEEQEGNQRIEENSSDSNSKTEKKEKEESSQNSFADALKKIAVNDADSARKEYDKKESTSQDDAQQRHKEVKKAEAEEDNSSTLPEKKKPLSVKPDSQNQSLDKKDDKESDSEKSNDDDDDFFAKLLARRRKEREEREKKEAQSESAGDFDSFRKKLADEKEKENKENAKPAWSSWEDDDNDIEPTSGNPILAQLLKKAQEKTKNNNS